MKISHYNKNQMKTTILSDLFDKPEDALKIRKENIAKQNRLLYLAPYQHIIDKLPESLIAHNRNYRVQIRYKQNSESIGLDIDEVWTYYYDDGVICPTSFKNMGYNNPSSEKGVLDPSLHVEAAAVANDLIAIRKEKKELTDFLEDTLAKWSGPKQLRTVWPASLHKYLPAIKPRAPKKTVPKPDAPEAIAAPASLNNRLTTNLLEGS